MYQEINILCSLSYFNTQQDLSPGANTDVYLLFTPGATSSVIARSPRPLTRWRAEVQGGGCRDEGQKHFCKDWFLCSLIVIVWLFCSSQELMSLKLTHSSHVRLLSTTKRMFLSVEIVMNQFSGQRTRIEQETLPSHTSPLSSTFKRISNLQDARSANWTKKKVCQKDHRQETQITKRHELTLWGNESLPWLKRNVCNRTTQESQL